MYATHLLSPEDMSLLLVLPSELRRMIYEYVLLADTNASKQRQYKLGYHLALNDNLTRNRRIVWRLEKDYMPGSTKCPAILQLCRQVYLEAIKIFF